MDTEEIKQVTEKDNIHNKSNPVLVVQITVCIILVAIIIVAGKLNPDLFEYIKTRYNEYMSSSISTTDTVEAIKDVADDVLDSASINAKAEELPDKEVTTEETTTKIAVSVMATATKEDEITVPVHGNITSKFGGRTNPISGVYANHTGVDIAASSGTEILAAYSGIVEGTGTTTKAGNYIKLLHSDGSETLYCHCSEIIADEGDRVTAGDIIAKVGSTGWSTGPHLHFEIKIDGESIDPLTVLTEKNGAV